MEVVVHKSTLLAWGVLVLGKGVYDGRSKRSGSVCMVTSSDLNKHSDQTPSCILPFFPVTPCEVPRHM